MSKFGTFEIEFSSSGSIRKLSRSVLSECRLDGPTFKAGIVINAAEKCREANGQSFAAWGNQIIKRLLNTNLRRVDSNIVLLYLDFFVDVIPNSDSKTHPAFPSVIFVREFS